VVIMLWIYIFIKINKILSYQGWKIYLYYEYKYLLKTTQYNVIEKNSNLWIEIFRKNLAIFRFCSFIIGVLKKSSKYLYGSVNLNERLHFLRHLSFEYIARRIKIFVFSILIIIFIYDCYINNFILIYTKYYLLFYMIFHLWCKLSDFAQCENIGINELLFERTYCFPKIVYINLTEEEEESLLMYCKNIPLDDYDRTGLLFNVVLKKQYIAQDPSQYFYYNEEGEKKPMPYLCYYTNDWVNEGFPDIALKKINGKYFVKENF
jgi:hypothetical protein